MICQLCNKKLRKCKRIDIPDRRAHFKCIDKYNKEQYDKELADFIQFLSIQINKIDLGN